MYSAIRFKLYVVRSVVIRWIREVISWVIDYRYCKLIYGLLIIDAVLSV
jgi:hypothetical protein